VSTDFEGMRIALAMGLMTLCFLVLPVFFLWRDKRADEQEAETLRDNEAVGVGPDQGPEQ
jgi:cbb3-type cytochrome oxidase subunit 3